MELDAVIRALRNNPAGVLPGVSQVLRLFLWGASSAGSSHRVYRTPWHGDPRVNIQSDRGMAKAYQVRQVIRALEKLRDEG